MSGSFEMSAGACAAGEARGTTLPGRAAHQASYAIWPPGRHPGHPAPAPAGRYVDCYDSPGGACAGLTLGLLLWSGAALAQTQTPPPAASPQKVEGQVVSIDQKSGKVVIHASDGKPHEFQANAETLKDLKVGDRIEARLRQ